ncbi:SDR family oxidoreductase [Actinomadura barringtoniae]|uniref:SDR family oxidoreductase n=1 Tax=Actinomadura barringtoniae TaxID=1427535 RepID=A0A939PAL4_9ACTN|nr:SDR family oxidoreductase [Actinomadura barringtoniae]MBO2449111.1 SDR family oxidoreductase [Actinomadura barringtoniae]
MVMALEGKVAIVTGAATGLGAAIAVELAARGASVVVNHLPEQAEQAAEVVARANEASGGGKAVAAVADIGDTEQLGSLFETATARFGGVDILVNNAVLPVLKPMAEVTEEEFDRSFRVNARAPFFAMQLAARHLRDGGRVVNISSHTTGLFFPRYGLYDGAKGALEQFSRVFSKEIGERGITVNVVSPGPTDTPEFRTRPADFIASLEKMTAMGRIGQPEEIVKVVAFLASPEASWVTGQNIRVNGGVV